METRPCSSTTEVNKGPHYPATYVSWVDAVEFCRTSNSRGG